ncbi:MAG: DUF63 family protein [Haloarculaceae archaeon]
MQTLDDVDSERAWVVAAVLAVLGLVAGSVAFPRSFYDGFVWRYFWGPVHADATNAACAVNTGTSVKLFASLDACRAAAASGGFVAQPGYTPVSEVGYMVVLLFMLVGVLFLLRRLQVAEDTELFFALVPFMLFGGALRVVEDTFDATPAGVDQLVAYPYNTLIISPIIYVTVFLVTLVALVAAVWLETDGYVRDYHRVLAAVGAAILTVTVGFLLATSLTTEYVRLYPQMTILTVAVASVLALGIYYGTERYKPEINRGTGRVGLVVVWGHAIDGVANVIAADWTGAIGIPLTYGAKHPVNRFIIRLSASVLPDSVIAAVGTSWPFLVVKLAVAVGIVWLFDETFMDESPRYAVLLLIAAVAVGLGPGTRDMLRVTFGI